MGQKSSRVDWKLCTEGHKAEIKMSARLWGFLEASKGKNPLPGSGRMLAEVGGVHHGAGVLVSLPSSPQPPEAACIPWLADSSCIFTSSKDGPNPSHTVKLRLPLQPHLLPSPL